MTEESGCVCGVSGICCGRLHAEGCIWAGSIWSDTKSTGPREPFLLGRALASAVGACDAALSPAMASHVKDGVLHASTNDFEDPAQLLATAPTAASGPSTSSDKNRSSDCAFGEGTKSCSVVARLNALP